MLHSLTPAVFKPLVGITAIVTTVASTLYLASPAAPPTSPAASTTGIGPLTLERYDGVYGWVASDTAMVADTKFRITGEADTEVGSYVSLLCHAYTNEWFRDTYDEIGNAFLQEQPTTCAYFNPNDTYDEMPDIVVGQAQFGDFCEAAIAAAEDEEGHECETACGVHDFMQPMLKPSSGDGVVNFQDYFRWGSEQEAAWNSNWSRPETVRKWVSIWKMAEQTVQRQADAAGVTLPSYFFTCTAHPNFRDAVVEGDLKIIVQVVSLQGPDLDPSEFTPEGEDYESSAQGPPGLIVLPSNSHFRTSNHITFDLGGTAGNRHWDMALFAPEIRTALYGQQGGQVSAPITPIFDGSSVLLTRVGYLPVWRNLTHGPGVGEGVFSLTENIPTGLWDLTKIRLPGYSDTVLTGNNIFSVYVTN